MCFCGADSGCLKRAGPEGAAGPSKLGAPKGVGWAGGGLMTMHMAGMIHLSTGHDAAALPWKQRTPQSPRQVCIQLEGPRKTDPTEQKHMIIYSFQYGDVTKQLYKKR